MKLESLLQLNGLRVRDKVTNFEGVVTSVCFDLYGCIQALVQPCVKDAGEKAGRYPSGEAYWFDVNRIKIINNTPVMRRSNYENAIARIKSHKQNDGGAADKPAL